jgi:hypothetical protein
MAALIISKKAGITSNPMGLAWDGNPTCNLYNGADLPASPFRTDDFPLGTADARYGKALRPVPAPQTK